MDNLYCDGNEDELTMCRFDGWGQSDCDSTEAAGVICYDEELEEELEKSAEKSTRKPVM